MSKLQALADRYVGTRAKLLVERNQIEVEVVIKDVRRLFGRTEFRVEPVADYGSAWVTAYKLILPQGV